MRSQHLRRRLACVAEDQISQKQNPGRRPIRSVIKITQIGAINPNKMRLSEIQSDHPGFYVSMILFCPRARNVSGVSADFRAPLETGDTA